MTKLPVRWIPDELMTRAFALAVKWHGAQVRKGNDDPYISHLMAVSALVIEYGGTQEQAAAALLHDILEDTECTKDVLVAAVGQEVADIVEACTHAETAKTGNTETDFIQRKQLYIDHLLDPLLRESAAVLVALADKTHNAESTARNWDASTKDPQTFFIHYNGNFESQKWWYESLANVFTELEVPEQLLDRFRTAVTTIFGGSLITHMNQNINNGEQPENKGENADSMDSFFDLNQDGKVSISETVKADAELAETYAESAEKQGGPKGKLAGIFSRLFKAVDKNK